MGGSNKTSNNGLSSKNSAPQNISRFLCSDEKNWVRLGLRGRAQPFTLDLKLMVQGVGIGHFPFPVPQFRGGEQMCFDVFMKDAAMKSATPPFSQITA